MSAAILLLLAVLFVAPVSAADGDAIPLTTKEDVYALASIVNGDANSYAYAVFKDYYPAEADTEEKQRAFLRTAKFVITADMTLSSKDGFMGIGKDETNSFAGSINGGDHTITFDINSADYPEGTTNAYFGLIGRMAKDENADPPVIENINFTGSIISENYFTLIASAVGETTADVTVKGITSDVTISGTHTQYIRIGGIVCKNNGELSDIDCSGELSIHHQGGGWAIAGGLVAYMDAGSIKDSTFHGTIKSLSEDTSSTGLIAGYSNAHVVFENIVATGDVTAEAHGSFLYNGALGGRAGAVTAKNIVIRDHNLYIGQESNQARVGILLSGPHYQLVTLENCLVKDCAIVISGETGNNFQVAGVVGYSVANPLVMKNVVSNCEIRTDGDIGTNTKFTGFVQSGGMGSGSENNLFSANKAGILAATTDDATKNVGIAGFYANERIAVPKTGSAVIATNSAPVDTSKLSDLQIQWGVRNGETLTSSLPAGMSVSYDETTGQTATLTTTDAAVGTYDLVAYVERIVNGVSYTLEMADVTVVVSEATPTITAVSINDGETAVSETLRIQALSDKKTLSATVTTEGEVQDTAGVVWKFFDNSDKEISSAIMGQYVHLTKDATSLTINPDLSIREEYTFKVKAISVVDEDKYDEVTVTITKPTVTAVTFTADEGTVGTGTESDPYVVSVGNTITGQGNVIMNDGKPHSNQDYTATRTVLVGKNTNTDQHLKASIVRDNSITLTAMSEGKVKVTLTSSTDTSITREPFYVLIKAPVTALTLESSDITDNKVTIAASQFETDVGSLTATATVSTTTLKKDGNGETLTDTASYREVTTVTFTSSNETVATIDSNGKITAKNFGSVTFTAETVGLDKDGKKLTKTYTLLIGDQGKTDQETPTGLTAVDTSFCDTEDGKITGLTADNTYEYRLVTDSAYTAVTKGQTEIINLKAGTFLVRHSGNETHNPSFDVELIVQAGGKHLQDAPAGLTVQNASTTDSMDGAILGVSDKMEYTSAFGLAYRQITGDMIENLAAGTYKVRYAETDTHEASEDAVITVAVWYTYDITEGNDQTIEADGSLNVVVDVEFSKFDNKIQIDGKDVDPTYYEAKEGSTIITMKGDYISTLTAGDHTLTIIFKDGEARTTFTVKEKTPGNPPVTPPVTPPATPSGSESTTQGSSVWLTEPQTTPTPTETVQPTQTDSVPTDIPTAQPTPTQTESPGFGVLAVLAGLGAVAVLRRK